MADVYESKPDERQTNEKIKFSRFRPRYRPLSPDELAIHDAIKTKAEELCELYNKVPIGRAQALAVTKLEESVMWAIKGLTA